MSMGSLLRRQVARAQTICSGWVDRHRIPGACLRQLNRHNAVARQVLHAEYVFSVQNTAWVSTHGLAHSCDIRKERLLSGDPMLPDLARLFEADCTDHTSVYLC